MLYIHLYTLSLYHSLALDQTKCSALLAQKAFLEGDKESFDVEATQELLKSVGVKLDGSTPPEARLCEIYERLEDIDAVL